MLCLLKLEPQFCHCICTSRGNRLKCEIYVLCMGNRKGKLVP